VISILLLHLAFWGSDMNTRWLWQGLLGLAMLAQAHWVWADPAPSADWQARCKLGQQAFGVRFHSVSGDVTNDDMQVMLTWPNGRSVKLALPPAWYHSMALTSAGVPNLCDTVVVTAVDRQHILLWLASDNRPGFDKLSLALVELPDGRVLDSKLAFADIKSADEGDTHLTLRRHHNDVDVRLVREVLVDTNDDSAYNYIEDWMGVGTHGNRIGAAWLRP
jgi:hypothetical protein